MENASKALLMAGGMLIALLVIGALLLVFNQIGDYEKGKSNIVKSTQVADFNKEFAKYTGDDIKGYDLVTLIHKAIDFNSKKDMPTKDGTNYVDYSKEMTITIKNMQNFIKNHGTQNGNEIFSGNEYSLTKESNGVYKEFIKKNIDYENKYTIQKLEALSTEDFSDENLKKILGVTTKEFTKKDMDQYREYSEFKSSTFKSTNVGYDGNQIVSLTFAYVK